MAKVRSPRYPGLGLKESVELAEKVYAADYQNSLPRMIVAQHMGYSGLNGAALTALSALGKFGLLEGRGDDTKISDLALHIIAHEPGSRERVEALQEAAGKPELFGELDAKFQGGKASDQAIRAYLLTQKFIPSGADAAIRSYRDTKAFVEAESKGYTTPEKETVMEIAPGVTSHIRARGGFSAPPTAEQIRAAHVPASEDEPFRVSFTGSGIEIVARLTNEASADELMRAVSALKMLLKPSNQVKRPEGSYYPGEPVTKTGLYDRVHAGGHAPQQTVRLGTGQMFPHCDECGDQAYFKFKELAD